uniref:Uncharacterized protein n=1 Tax=Anguilla anguilla TaxID=7936 RepID=A0A0E9VZ16_ANGAN
MAHLVILFRGKLDKQPQSNLVRHHELSFIL